MSKFSVENSPGSNSGAWNLVASLMEPDSQSSSVSSATATQPTKPSSPAGRQPSANSITAEIVREIIAFGEGEERSAVVSCVTPAGQQITIKGRAEEGELIAGLPYVFSGKWQDTPKYGRQFHFQHFVKQRPHGRKGLLAYLKTVPNIGDVIAGKLYDIYQEKCLDALKQNPSEVSARIPKLRLPLAKEAAEYLREQEDMEHATVDLLDLFASSRVSRRVISQMVNRWGCRTTEIVRKNPYVMMGFSGIGHATADRMYMSLGHDPAKLKRQTWFLWSMLRKRGGDTWVDIATARNALRDSIGSAATRIEDAIKLGVRAKLLAVTDESGRLLDRDNGGVAAHIAMWRNAMDERRVAETIADLSRHAPLWPKVSDIQGLYDHQRERLAIATKGSVGCLIGTPGTGKSSSAARLISAVVRLYGSDQVAVCCPTGKAAVRITDLLNNNGIDITARTIHSTLGIPFGSGDYGGDGSTAERGDESPFNYNEDNPLPVKFVFVDETSMVDCSLMACLLRACAPGTNILFIGDPNQLPPVGHGCPLRDMIASGVPTGELTEIHRNGGRIVTACKQIRETGRFDFSPEWNPDSGENLVIQELRTPESILLRLESLYRKLQETGKYDMRWQVQTLCALNTSGILSRKSINDRLREIVNPSGQRVSGNKFRVGDKVICLRNSQLPAVDAEDEQADERGRIRVANGEMGEVLSVAPRMMTVEMRNPLRRIKVLMGKAKDGDEDDSQDKTDSGCDFDLAYAAVCHKYQGDEVKLVFIVGDDSFSAGMVADRAWIYTAISRAKYGCIYIGKKDTVDFWCSRMSLDSRRTFLVEKLREPLAKALANPIDF